MTEELQEIRYFVCPCCAAHQWLQIWEATRPIEIRCACGEVFWWNPGRKELWRAEDKSLTDPWFFPELWPKSDVFFDSFLYQKYIAKSAAS